MCIRERSTRTTGNLSVSLSLPLSVSPCRILPQLPLARRKPADKERAMSKITSWMSWEGGVDLCAATQGGLAMPNVIIHVARMVHTPNGSAPAGMILYQPDPAAPPLVMGFCSPD